MAIRIGEHVVQGQLSNVQHNSVAGWLDFGGDCGLKIELSGNLNGQFEGRHIRFFTGHCFSTSHCFSTGHGEEQLLDESTSAQLDALEMFQIGAVGDVLLRTVRVPVGPIKESDLDGKMGELLPCDEKPCLYLEWFSQNGRVVAEIVDVTVEFVNEENKATGEAVPNPLPDTASAGDGPGITAFSVDEEGNVREMSTTPDNRHLDEESDPYQILPANLDERIDESLLHSNGAVHYPDRDSHAGMRSWDEVIPGLDAETKRMYEEWDEVVHGEKEEPLCALFDPPLKLESPDQVASEEDAESLLNSLLARLAQHNVAIDICEHFSALDTYRWLIEEILPEANIHPELPRIGFVEHYSTWEDCPRCAAEFEA